MKLTMILILLFSVPAIASEVATDCPAMNHSREKIVKTPSAKKVRSSSQVTGQ